MDLRLITIAICGFAIALVGVGEAFCAYKAIDGVARNPEAGDKVRTTLIIGVALVETCAIYNLVLAILVLFAA